MRPAVSCVLALGLVAGGCASREPPAGAAAARSHVAAEAFRTPGADAGAFDARWWEAAADAALVAVVRQAQRLDLDARAAIERVDQARAAAAAAGSRALPAIGVGGSVSQQGSGLPPEFKRASPDVRAVRASVDLAWEIDLFGAARAATDAARLEAASAAEAADAARLLAAGEAARLYVGWQGARARVERLKALLEAQRQTERLVRAQEAAGQASGFDVARASAEARGLEAQLPPARAAVDLFEHQIAVLLGRPPGAPLPELDGAPIGPPEMPALAPGQPADLLARRPDLRAAERRLDAEAARLRQARAERLPRVVLSALLGRQDLRVNGFDLSPVRFGNAALAFALPVFDAGRLRAFEDLASARERESALRYERAVLGALQEVEASLVALAQGRERGPLLQALLDDRRRALAHARSLRREGQADLLSLLDAERGVIAAELSLLDHRTQFALDGVRLYRALGGGWRFDTTTGKP